MNDPMFDQLLATLGRYRFLATAESELQDALSRALNDALLPHWREVRLSAKDRIDFLVLAPTAGGDAAPYGAKPRSRVGLEVKVSGSCKVVGRQLLRYAEHDGIDGLVLFTTRSPHRSLPSVLSGKPLHVHHLIGSAFG